MDDIFKENWIILKKELLKIFPKITLFSKNLFDIYPVKWMQVAR